MAIVLKTISDSQQAQADLAKLRESVNNIETSAKKVSDTFSNFTKALAAGAGLIAGIVSITKLSDSVTNLESKLKVATNSQLEFNIALNQTRQIAIDTRTDLDSVTNLYARLNRSAQAFGASQADVSLATSLISKAIATSGASLQESNAAVQQLGQALASGKLAGDELRSILENAPPLAKAIADGLGVSIGKLRQLGEEGSLSAAKVFKAILSQQKQIESSFQKVDVTFGQAFQNLRTSLVVLAAEARKAVLGSTGGLASSINNIAKSIFNFASTFGLTFAIAKLDAVLFVTDVVRAFTELWDYLKETGVKVKDFVVKLYEDWKPVILSLINDLIVWANIALVSSIAVGKSLYDSFSKTDIGQYLIKNVTYAIVEIKKLFNSAFTYIGDKLPKIDVLKFFPGLTPALEIVKKWAIAVEGWFAWLYDKVIGNSWIPDLVNKTGDWLAKLVGGPLASIYEFVTKANGGLAKIGIGIGGGLFAFLGKLKSYLLGLIFIIGSAGAAALGVRLLLDKDARTAIKIEAPNLKDQVIKKLQDALTKVSDNIGKLVNRLKEAFGNSDFGKTTAGRNIKQLLGMRDTVPGSVYGTTIDTSPQSMVGRGPMRKQEDRPFGHDFINMLPGDWKIPFIAAFTGVFALALVGATEQGMFRSAMLSALTTVAGIYAVKVVPDSEIKKTGGTIAFGFLDVVEKGLTALFSGNVLKDPLGVLSTIAKTSLLFEQGRKAIGQAALSLATAPTRLAQSATSAMEGALLRRDVAKTDSKIANLPKNLDQVVKNSERALNSTITRLASLRDVSGATIGTQRATAAVSAGNLGAFGTAASRAEIGRATVQTEALNVARTNLAQTNALRTELTASRTASDARAAEISKRLAEQATAVRGGVVSTAAGAGGILGGLAGFQIGTEIARGMTDSPPWVKVGTALAISFAGQAVGAGIGSLLAQGFLATIAAAGSVFASLLTVAAGILLNPFVLGGLAIAAAIGAVLNWDTLVATFDSFLAKVGPVIEPILESLKAKFFEFTDYLKKELPKAFDKLITEFPEILKSTFDGFKQFWSKTIDPAIGSLVIRIEKSIPELQSIAREVLNRTQNLPGLGQVSNQEIAAGAGAAGITAFIASKIDIVRTTFTALATAISSGIGSLIASAKSVFETMAIRFLYLIDDIKLLGPRLLADVRTFFMSMGRTILDAIKDKVPLIRQALMALGAIGGVITAALASPALAATIGVIVTGAIAYGLYKLLMAGMDAATVPKMPTAPTETSSGAASSDQIPTTRRASGGGVFGPGNATSDSIPAMLSNGEFVVNAKDARANWELLTAINSGYKPQGFAEGTEKSSTTPQDFLSSVVNYVKKNLGFANTAINNAAVPGITPITPGRTPAVSDRNVTSTIEGMLGSVKDVDTAFERTADALKTAGFDKVANAGVIKSFALVNPDKFRTIANALDKITEGYRNAADPKLSPFLQAENKKRADDAARAISELVSASGIGAPGSKIVDAGVETKPTKVTLGDQFKQVQEAFPELALTLEEFRNVEQKTRLDLVRNAIKVNNDLKKLSSTEIGTLEGGVNVPGELVKKEKDLEDARRKQLPGLRESLKKFRTPFADFEIDLKEVGLNISREAFNSLDGIDLAIIDGLRRNLKFATDALKDPKQLQDPEERAAIEAFAKRTNKEISKVLASSAEKQGNPFEQFKAALSKGGFQFDEAALNMLTPIEQAFLKGAAKQVEDNKAKLAELQEAGIFGDTAIFLQTQITEIAESVNEFIKTKAPGYKTKSKLAGEALASETGEGIYNGLTEVFKGKLKPSQFVKNMANSFSSSVVNSFVKGLVDPLTGENGIVTNFLKSIGSQLFKMGGSTGSSLFSGALSMLGLGGSGASTGGFGLDPNSILFKASGGYVSGPGTGTSDSIPAMLSDGEYVIKASAVKENIDLLNSINSGKFAKFADGGIVGESMAATPNIYSPSSLGKSGQPSQQIVNVNITGDISRQTKSEIYQMLPSIAEGVNSHNRERGFRG